MDFCLTDDQQNIREAVLNVCSQFNDDFWLQCDNDARFPIEFHRTMAQSGWL